MNRQIIVNRVPGEQRIAVLENKKSTEFAICRDTDNNYLDNIYRGIVRRVIPGMQSAFVEFGGEKSGFIHIKDIKKDISYEEYTKHISGDSSDQKEDQKESIRDYIKDGSAIIVQVVKEQIGSKGAKLTSHVSISGRFAVLMPTIRHIGISKKITDREQRAKLKEIGKKVKDKGFGVILRTMAASATPELLEKELVELITKWQSIEGKFKKEKGAKLLNAAPTHLIELIKNTYSKDIAEIVVDSKRDYNAVKDYLNSFIPEKKEMLTLHELPYPIFDYYNIEPDIEMTLKRKIWMRSGGFLYIEQTEALTVIDVNTGKFLGKDSLEKTVFKTNLEAIEEIAYHIRLRNLAGIIVVDFIDMKSHGNRQKLLTALEESLKSDPAKTSYYNFTRLGLVQITRKRTSESNTVLLTETCPHCRGTGQVKSKDTIAFSIFREIQRNVKLYNNNSLEVMAHPELIFQMKHQLSKEVSELEKELKISLTFTENTFPNQEHFDVIVK